MWPRGKMRNKTGRCQASPETKRGKVVSAPPGGIGVSKAVKEKKEKMDTLLNLRITRLSIRKMRDGQVREGEGKESSSARKTHTQKPKVTQIAKKKGKPAKKNEPGRPRVRNKTLKSKKESVKGKGSKKAVKRTPLDNRKLERKTKKSSKTPFKRNKGAQRKVTVAPELRSGKRGSSKEGRKGQKLKTQRSAMKSRQPLSGPRKSARALPDPHSEPLDSKPLKPNSKLTFVKFIETGVEEYEAVFNIIVMKTSGVKTIVASFSQTYMRSFYTKGKRDMHSNLNLPGQVFDITKITDTKGAATIHDKRQIAIFHVTPVLVLDSLIDTERSYVGVACLNPTTLAASGTFSNVCVDILDISGTVLRSVEEPYLEMPMCRIVRSIGDFHPFQVPAFLATTNENCILVSDCYDASVVCLSDVGGIKFVYRPGKEKMDFPRSVTCNSRGDIFVVDCRGERIVQLNENGEHVRDVLSKKSDLNGLYADGDRDLYTNNGKRIAIYRFE